LRGAPIPAIVVPGMGRQPTVFHVDAFTDRPFAGNPAAVCVLAERPEDGWLQALAREMNLPATAFVRADGRGWTLRWFSPTVELEFCGHGTLATAHVLWEAGHLSPEAPAHFLTGHGLLTAERQGDWIELDVPAEPAGDTEAPPALAQALGVSPQWIGRNRLDYLVEVENEAVVRALAPDLGLLATVPTRGVIVTARASAPWDFVSRFFAPRVGIPEDPVTGSAHCCLGPFWAGRLGKRDLLAHQASSRGGVVRVGLRDDRVRLGGQAVTVAHTELR
jgi:PhzF family phenazine biosynthesis protein